MDRETLNFVVISAASLINLAILVYQTFKKVPGEVQKMQAEKIESYAEAAESTMQGAQISNNLLLQRIEELKRRNKGQSLYIEMLEKQLTINGLMPVPRPNTDELLKKS